MEVCKKKKKKKKEPMPFYHIGICSNYSEGAGPLLNVWWALGGCNGLQ